VATYEERIEKDSQYFPFTQFTEGKIIVDFTSAVMEEICHLLYCIVLYCIVLYYVIGKRTLKSDFVESETSFDTVDWHWILFSDANNPNILSVEKL
jgi:hypothetical protein